VREGARKLVQCEGVAVVIRSGEVMRYVDEDAVGRLFIGKEFPIDQCISGTAVRARGPIVIPDVYADPRVLARSISRNVRAGFADGTGSDPR
jgi:hypothetical protein